MAVNYDLCAYKLSLPEVAVNGSRCSVKLTFIGKDTEAETQLMILSCQLVSLKKEVFSVELQPDMMRVGYNIRVSAQGDFEKPASGFGLVGAELHLTVVDLQKKQQADISFKRGADRKWTLEDMKLTEPVEIDRSLIRERRRKMRKSIL